MAWNEERDALVRKHYNRKGGLTADELGAQLGVTRNAVIGRARRLGLCRSAEDAALNRRREAERSRQRRERGRPPLVSLTAEQIEAVRTARLAGQGPAQISRTVGIDVNRIQRIVAAFKREGVEFPPIKTTEGAPRLSSGPARKPRSEQFPEGHEVWSALPDTAPVLLVERTGCRWPIGDATGERQLFCDAPTERTYCDCHHAAAYRPSTKHERGLNRYVLRQAGFEGRAVYG